MDILKNREGSGAMEEWGSSADRSHRYEVTHSYKTMVHLYFLFNKIYSQYKKDTFKEFIQLFCKEIILFVIHILFNIYTRIHDMYLYIDLIMAPLWSHLPVYNISKFFSFNPPNWFWLLRLM